MTFRRLLTLVLVLAAPLPLAAEEARKITLRTLCFSHVNNVKKLYLPAAEGGGLVEVPLFTEVFSLPIQATVTDNKASFFLSSTPPTPGKPAPALPAVNVPASAKVLFLFLPNPGKPEAPYLVVPMADDESSFPLGTTKAINLTPANVRFDLGELSADKGKLVGPGKTVIIEAVRKVNHLNQYDAKVLFETAPKEFTEFYNSRWRSVSKKRDIAIVYMDPVSKMPAVNLYEDAPTPAPAPATATAGGQ
ncbi:hypothetical protein [Haloferula sp. BvORR071]|uniref:hypothetical protein n=1 Tax=Haloferula sp. BvORR071 TaxID=1396141 RepID=UPI000B0A5783|nr:hypothetical protein [Haloferula sp. BvORR071]